MKQLRTSFLLLATLVASLGVSRADVILTLQDPNPSVLPGSVITVLATAFNNDAATVNLNSLSLNISSPLTVDDSAFLNNWFTIAGNSFFNPNPQPLFDILVPLSAPAGPYSVTVTLLGGPDVSDQNILNTAAQMTVTVTGTADIPEPGSVTLVAAGLALAMLRARRHAR